MTEYRIINGQVVMGSPQIMDPGHALIWFYPDGTVSPPYDYGKKQFLTGRVTMDTSCPDGEYAGAPSMTSLSLVMHHPLPGSPSTVVSTASGDTITDASVIVGPNTVGPNVQFTVQWAFELAEAYAFPRPFDVQQTWVDNVGDVQFEYEHTLSQGLFPDGAEDTYLIRVFLTDLDTGTEAPLRLGQRDDTLGRVEAGARITGEPGQNPRSLQYQTAPRIGPTGGNVYR